MYCSEASNLNVFHTWGNLAAFPVPLPQCCRFEEKPDSCFGLIKGLKAWLFGMITFHFQGQELGVKDEQAWSMRSIVHYAALWDEELAVCSCQEPYALTQSCTDETCWKTSQIFLWSLIYGALFKWMKSWDAYREQLYLIWRMFKNVLLWYL